MAADTAQYRAMRRWRERNPDKNYRAKLDNYRQTQNAANSGAEWTGDEEQAITAEGRPSDRDLSAALGRSMKAIQNRRSVLKKTVRSTDDDWPTCWCPLSGPKYGHLWHPIACPAIPTGRN